MQNDPFDFPKLTDDTLVAATKYAAHREREATQVVLQHLLEVERRRLYLKLGYPSLFDFCLRELGYCAGSAHLRIQAMRLIRDVAAPAREEISRKLSSGTLTLSQLSNVQTYSRQVLTHRVQPEQKLEILKKLEGQPTRESQKIILGELGLAGSAHERLRVRGPDQVELTLTLDAETVELLEEWKALTSHSNPEGRNGEALRGALKVAVERARKERGVTAGAGSGTGRGAAAAAETGPVQGGLPALAPLHAHEVVAASIPAAIPQAIRRLVWARDEGRCTYRDLRSGKRCDGRHYLEIDHITPRAHGGRHELRNLRLLCGGHHRLRHAVTERSWDPAPNQRKRESGDYRRPARAWRSASACVENSSAASTTASTSSASLSLASSASFSRIRATAAGSTPESLPVS